MTFRMWMEDMIKAKEKHKEIYVESESWHSLIRLQAEIDMLNYLYEDFRRYPFFDEQK